MSNGDDPPAQCDRACQTKIIINGGNIQGIARANYDALLNLPPEARQRLDGEKLIKILNRMEDDAVEVQKLIAKGAGYTGPTGKMLEGE